MKLCNEINQELLANEHARGGQPRGKPHDTSTGSQTNDQDEVLLRKTLIIELVNNRPLTITKRNVNINRKSICALLFPSLTKMFG